MTVLIRMFSWMISRVLHVHLRIYLTCVYTSHPIRIEANSMHIDCIHTTPCSMHIQWDRFESGFPFPYVVLIQFKVDHTVQPNAQLHVVCSDRNVNMLFNAHFNQH